MTGPSTNLYVGPQKKHYTIPKRLFCHFSGYAKAFLEGGLSEASANAISLPDVDADVFQYLWQWLYTGKVRLNSFYASNTDLDGYERLVQACQLLCRLHILGEHLLFDYRFLESGVQMQLETVIEEAKREELPIPLRPDIVEEVVSRYALAQYTDFCSSFTLRPVVLRHLCNFQFCTTVDFTDYENCFQKDGALAAELLVFLASEIKWANKRCEAQVGRRVYMYGIEQQFTGGQGSNQLLTTNSQTDEGVWIALRYVCTSEAYTTHYIRSFSRYFELNAAFAAAFLNQMAKELLWTIERWGEERGRKVDVAVEKEEERITNLEQSV